MGSLRTTFRAGAVAALLLPAVALAQPAAPAPQPAPVAAQPALSPAAKAAIDQRIGELKTRLAITPAQEPAWTVFAQTIRDNTAETDALFYQRTGNAASMTAPENMHSYAQIARAYADNTERLAAAFDTLYAALTDAQKRAADTLFREQAAEAQKPAPR